jgi:hypothetical protein
MSSFHSLAIRAGFCSEKRSLSELPAVGKLFIWGLRGKVWVDLRGRSA